MAFERSDFYQFRKFWKLLDTIFLLSRHERWFEMVFFSDFSARQSHGRPYRTKLSRTKVIKFFGSDLKSECQSEEIHPSAGKRRE